VRVALRARDRMRGNRAGAHSDPVCQQMACLAVVVVVVSVGGMLGRSEKARSLLEKRVVKGSPGPYRPWCWSSFPLTKLLGSARKKVLRDVAQPGSAPASGAGGR